MGLKYSLFSNNVEDRGYGAGRYWLGLGGSFIRFPSTVVTIQFSNEADSKGDLLRSRTSDGLEVELEVSFQYQLNVSSIYGLYTQFGEDYEKVFVTSAMDVVTIIATRYNATAFFTDRTRISADMEKSLKSHFDKLGADIPYFQLRSVELPPPFEKAIQDTEVKKQDIQTAEAEKENQEVTMETKVLQAQQKALEIALQANATGQQILLDAHAYVAQFELAQQLQAKSYKPIYEEYLKDEKTFMDYMQVRTLRNHPDTHSVVNLQRPVATVKGPEL